jgi:hypothetical protein
MSDRRTFLENAAAAIVMTKISSLTRSGSQWTGRRRLNQQCQTVKKPGCVAQSSSTPRRSGVGQVSERTVVEHNLSELSRPLLCVQ